MAPCCLLMRRGLLLCPVAIRPSPTAYQLCHRHPRRQYSGRWRHSGVCGAVGGHHPVGQGVRVGVKPALHRHARLGVQVHLRECPPLCAPPRVATCDLCTCAPGGGLGEPASARCGTLLKADTCCKAHRRVFPVCGKTLGILAVRGALVKFCAPRPPPIPVRRPRIASTMCACMVRC